MAKQDVKTDQRTGIPEARTVEFGEDDGGPDKEMTTASANAPTPAAQLVSGGEPVTSLPNETGTDVARDSLGRRKRRPGPAAKRKAYVAFNPDNVRENGEIQVELATFKADEVLAHLDANKGHRYVSFMI